MATTTTTTSLKKKTLTASSSPVTTIPQMLKKSAEDIPAASQSLTIPQEWQDMLKSIQDTVLKNQDTLVNNQESTSKVLEELKLNVTMLTDETRQFHTRFEKIQNILIKHEDQLQTIETKIAKTDEKMGRMDTHFARVNKRLENEMVMLEMDKSGNFLRFQNIMEEKEEYLREVMGEVLAGILGRDQTEILRDVDEVYRIYTSYARRNNLPKEVHVRFTKKSIRDEILQKTRLQAFTYKGKRIAVLPQIPKRVRDMRRQFEFLTTFLRKYKIRYRWLLPEGISFTWQTQRLKLESLQEAQDFYETQVTLFDRESEGETESKSMEEISQEPSIEQQDDQGKRMNGNDRTGNATGLQVETRSQRQKAAVSLRWTKLPPVWTNSRDHVREVPYMRYGHSAVLIDDTIYIWGGRNDTEGACNVLYAFDVSTHKWFTPKVSGMVPGARDGHSACVLGKSMYIFGGYEQLADCFSNDIHKLDSSNMMWSLICTKGTPARWRDFHSATIIGTKMYVFGGRADRFGPFHSNNEIYCNRIKVFDTDTNSWLDSPPTPLLPEGRRSHSAFGYNGELYIFGGYNARLNRHFHDLWKFDPVSFTWKKIEPKGKGPCPRRRQCCCRVGDKIILFGGTSPSPEEGMGDEFDLMDHSDLYILDFSPSLKTLCKLAVIQYNLDQSCLPHDIRWELSAMTTNSNISRPILSSHG